MNHYDYDGSSLPPKRSGPGMEPKICSHFLARARKELTTRSRISSIPRLSGNLSTFDAKERNSENHHHHHHHHHQHQQQQQQKESKKKITNPPTRTRTRVESTSSPPPPSSSNLLGFDIKQRNTTIPS